MEKKYVVIDHEGNVSYGMKGKQDALPETFSSYRAAEKRAKELAVDAPGETIGVYELTGEVVAPVGKVESARRHPIEHYQ